MKKQAGALSLDEEFDRGGVDRLVDLWFGACHSGNEQDKAKLQALVDRLGIRHDFQRTVNKRLGSKPPVAGTPSQSRLDRLKEEERRLDAEIRRRQEEEAVLERIQRKRGGFSHELNKIADSFERLVRVDTNARKASPAAPVPVKPTKPDALERIVQRTGAENWQMIVEDLRRKAEVGRNGRMLPATRDWLQAHGHLIRPLQGEGFTLRLEELGIRRSYNSLKKYLPENRE